MGLLNRGGGIRGYDDGGGVEDSNEIDDEMFRQEGLDKLKGLFNSPQGQQRLEGMRPEPSAPPPPIKTANLSDEPLVSIAREGSPESSFQAIKARGELPSVITGDTERPTALPYTSEDDAAPSAPPRVGGGLPSVPSLGGAQTAAQGDTSTKLASNPWMALINAGARMMQGPKRDSRGLLEGTNPLGQLLATTGHGVEAGSKTLQDQREEARKDQLAKFNAGMQLAPYSNMTAAQKAATSIAQQRLDLDTQIKNEAKRLERDKIDRDRYHAPMTTPFGDYMVSMPKNPAIDKPIYTPVNPDGTPKERGATTEPPPARTSVAPANGRVVTDDPESMLTSGNAGQAAERKSDIGQIYFDPRSRPAGHREAVDASKAVAKEVESANALDTRAKNMRHNLDIVTSFVNENKASSPALAKLLEPGITGEQRQKIINAAAYAMPGKVPPEVVAAVNSLGKDSVLGGFRNITAEGLSAREAQPIIKAAMGAMPSFSLPEQSSRVLLASMEQGAQRQRDRQAFLTDYRNKNGGFATGWETDFNKKYPPERYVAQAIYSILPEEKKRELPQAVQQLRGARDALMAAEKGGDKTQIEAARERYLKGKSFVDKNYGGLGNYMAFGTM
jgi:hypothetical protein